MQIRFKGGALRSLNLSKPKHAGQLRKTNPEIVQTIDKLLDDFTPGQIARQLNEQHLTSGTNRPFTRKIIQRIQRVNGLKPRYDRLRKRGLLTPQEIARRLNICINTLNIWARHDIIEAIPYDDKARGLYESPGPNAPRKLQGLKSPLKTRKNQLMSQRTHEVHYEA
jgi:hypothetical protein